MIDGKTDHVIAEVQAGFYLYALWYNVTSNKIYCANSWWDYPYSELTVTVIDGASNEVVATIGVGAGPRVFAWNPVQSRVYVANEGSSTISVIRDTSVSGVEESPKPQAASCELEPTVVRGVLVLGAVVVDRM